MLCLTRWSGRQHHVARQENDIGQEHALFYEAHATYYELRGSFAKAAAAFEDGIQR